MNWITVALMTVLAGQLVAVIYMIYRVWKEFSFTVQETQRLQEPIENLIQDGRRLQVLADSLSGHWNHVSNQAREVIEIGRDTSAQVGTLVAAANALRSPSVKLAIRYGRDWYEERRANPIVRTFKRVTRNFRKKIWKLKERLQND